MVMPALPVEPLLEAIFTKMGEGMSLSQITRCEGMPSRSWISKQIRERPEVRAAYEIARADRADYLADQMMELVNTEIPADLEPSARTAWVNLLRLKVDVAKFTASKLRPAVWGDKVSLEVSGTAQISVTQALEDAQKRVQHYYEIEAEVEDVSDRKAIPDTGNA